MKRARQSSSRDAGSSRSSVSEETVYDDSVGHLNAQKGDVILGRYEICRELGVGTFGKVYKCLDAKHKDVVALKVVRRIRKYRESARIEASILSDVYSRQKKERSNFIVKMYSHFEFDGYYCMVFERLGVSLYDFLKSQDHRGLPMMCVRDVAWQMIAGVAFLHRMRLIHTDLKLENILLMHSDAADYTYPDGSTVRIPRSWQVKIIDFGGATYDDERKSSTINTRQYRGPEVTLELGWSFPSDIWSVGCMIAEVYTGDLLFATHGNLEHLALMERCLGAFPSFVLKSPVFSKYFRSRDCSVRVSELSSSSQEHVNAMPALADLFQRQPGDASSGIVELLGGMLQLNPAKRTTAQQALEDERFFPSPPSTFGLIQ